jgi:hypothetical protein
MPLTNTWSDAQECGIVSVRMLLLRTTLQCNQQNRPMLLTKHHFQPNKTQATALAARNFRTTSVVHELLILAQLTSTFLVAAAASFDLWDKLWRPLLGA